MAITSTALKALLLLGLGGALLSSSILAGATLLLAMAGIAVIRRGSLYRTGWDTPKELRLLHFAFWFFVLTSAVSWAQEGLSLEGGRPLITRAPLLLFWPLVIAFSYARLKAKGVLAAFGLAAIAAIIAFTTEFYSHQGASETLFGGDINPVSRGNIALLGWIFLILIPLTVFARQIRNPHQPTACLAVAGAMLPVGYVILGLTGATVNHGPALMFYLLSVAAIAAAMFTELQASFCRQRKVKVSATVIAMNEEDHMADCLKSARLVADEIIVLDSGSTDRTVEIARQYADVVEVTDWPGFGIQKQRALEKATGDWVLSLDADERITPELAREINHHLAEPDADAYKLPWAVTIYGKRLDFGRSGRAPLRLFRREGVRFSDALVHERILIPEGRRTKTLRGRLTHYTHRDFGHSLEKSAKYAWLGSLEKHRQGKKTRTMIYPTVRGLMTFIQVYFIRFGFLDGAVGYLTAVTYGQVTFNKYAGLWTLRNQAQGSMDAGD